MEGDLPANTELKERFLVIRLPIDKDAVESAREFGKAFGFMEGRRSLNSMLGKEARRNRFIHCS